MRIDLIICSHRDGHKQTGLYVAAAHVIDKLNDQHVVDVFTATRHVKRVRPQFVADPLHYHFLFTIAERYIQKASAIASNETNI